MTQRHEIKDLILRMLAQGKDMDDIAQAILELIEHESRDYLIECPLCGSSV